MEILGVFITMLLGALLVLIVLFIRVDTSDYDAFGVATSLIKGVSLIIITLGASICAIKKAEAEPINEYNYIELKVGGFFEGCFDKVNCDTPDGRFPSYISLGHAWEGDTWNVDVELMHRSNLDIGFPVTKTGTPEYHRNGIFGKIRYKF